MLFNFSIIIVILTMSRVIDVLFGQETAQKIDKANLLIVGVGGIGCELLKSLSKSGFKKYTIVDLDTIQQTNLNRQFYFRKRHVGKSKADIGKECLAEIDPSIEITAIMGSILQQKYDVGFFSKFDIVISALDNMGARRHLQKMAIQAGKPIIDAGTEGLFGQTQTIIRYSNKCHNCSETKKQQSFAVCTIRDSPQTPIHCIHFAKSLFCGLFGNDQANPYISQINLKSCLAQQFTDEQIKLAGQKLFNILFFQKISVKSSNSPNIHPLRYQQAIKCQQTLRNPPSTNKQQKVRKQEKSKFKQQKLLSLSELAKMFVQSFFNIIKVQKQSIGSLTFEKDDLFCMRFVYSVASLRTYNFMNPLNSRNKHQFLSFFDCKDMAGKIIPAISSTNSIAASIETSDIIKIIEGRIDELKQVKFQAAFNPRIYSSNNKKTPNSNCSVCSARCVYLQLFCDFEKTTYRQLRTYLSVNFAYSRKPFLRNSQGKLQLFEYTNDQQNMISEQFNNFITRNEANPSGSLQLVYCFDDVCPVNLSAFVVNRTNSSGIGELDMNSSRNCNGKTLLGYFRKIREQQLDDQKYSVGKYGHI